MQVIETFGRYIEKLSSANPSQAQQLLKTGWQAQRLALKIAPEKELLPADRYLARLMMSMMLKPLKSPDESAIVSIFTPCELLQEVGLNPYNVECFSSYLAGSMAEQSFLQHAEKIGIPETLCSYHKIFIGAAEQGLLPKPGCIVYTNLVCDANLVTFRRLSEIYQVPSFMLDIPLQQNEESVLYVTEQLHEMAEFLETHTGNKIDGRQLSIRLERSQRTLQNYEAFRKLRVGRKVPSNLTTPLYAAIANNVLLGTVEEETYTEMLLDDIKLAPVSTAKQIYWMHILPFWSHAVQDALSLKDDVQIIGCDLANACTSDFDPENPYEAIATRMVYHGFNGGISRRIERGIRHAKEAKADGAVWFAHWGCKHTLAGSQMAKRKFEEAGIPLLILDGDGCNRYHGGEGQTATRLGAFLEMLNGGADE